MFRNRLLTLFALFLLVAFGVQAASGAQFGAGTDDVPVTQWVSVNGELPTSYAEWAAQQPPAAPDHVELMMETPPPSVEPPAAVGKVALIINSSIYNQLSGEIATWQADLQNEGWTVSVYSSTFSQPNALRSFLAGIANLKGAVLVGSFPVPWYENHNQPDGWPSTEEFPIDLYYMDLDGTWANSDGDSLFDGHSGDKAPEIWVGRLTAGNLPALGGEIALLRNYLHKNHAYRTGQVSADDSALLYVDDDWEWWASTWGDDMRQAYGAVTTYSDINTTRATHYRGQLQMSYDIVQVHVHSSAWHHSFKFNNGQSWESMWQTEVSALDPRAYFYNLFACSGSRYTESDYMAGHYVFAPTYGLGAVSSSKTGGMLSYDYFYNALGRDKIMGAAFREWFELVGISNKEWYYGMNWIGDPTLSVESNQTVTDWTGVNIGDVVSGGSTVNGTTINLNATDGDIWSTADGLRYVYKSGSGDQTFIAQLTNWNPGGVNSAKTGLMLRASTDPGAPEYTIHVTGSARAIRVKVRTASGGSTTNTNGPTSSSLPLWLKLVKSGNTVTGYYSTNGSNWTAVGGAQTLNGIGSSFLYGMAVASNSPSAQASATYVLSGGTTPTITGFSPTTGGPGTLVTINGTNLGTATGVTFNGTAASFAIVSATQLQANVPSGATTGPIGVTSPGGTATSATNFVVPGQVLNEVYVGAAKSGTVAGIAFTGADILHYTRAGNSWEMLFDASDVGLNGNVSAFTFLPNGSILMSLVANATLPGVGAVTPMDVIRFVPTQLGNNTVGFFEWYFDGSDVGLSARTEKIDAISYFQTAAGSQRLRISTTGTATVTDVDGGSLTAQDEDILLFVISSPGATTVGHWATSLHLDGSLIPGLAAEDVNGYGHDGVNEAKYLLISGTFNVAGAAGNAKSVVRLTPDDSAPGGYLATIVPWLASGATFPANLDGLEIVR